MSCTPSRTLSHAFSGCTSYGAKSIQAPTPIRSAETPPCLHPHRETSDVYSGDSEILKITSAISLTTEDQFSSYVQQPECELRLGNCGFMRVRLMLVLFTLFRPDPGPARTGSAFGYESTALAVRPHTGSRVPRSTPLTPFSTHGLPCGMQWLQSPSFFMSCMHQRVSSVKQDKDVAGLRVQHGDRANCYVTNGFSQENNDGTATNDTQTSISTTTNEIERVGRQFPKQDRK